MENPAQSLPESPSAKAAAEQLSLTSGVLAGGAVSALFGFVGGRLIGKNSIISAAVAGVVGAVAGGMISTQTWRQAVKLPDTGQITAKPEFATRVDAERTAETQEVSR